MSKRDEWEKERLKASDELSDFYKSNKWDNENRLITSDEAWEHNLIVWKHNKFAKLVEGYDVGVKEERERIITILDKEIESIRSLQSLEKADEFNLVKANFARFKREVFGVEEKEVKE